MSGNATVLADWWQRPDTRSTPPILERDNRIVLPTESPTSPPSQPTATPRVGEPGTPAPTSTTTTSSGGSTEDPCASGKSYTGPYCGWSPGVGGGGGGGGGGSPAQPARVGGPKVLGLSKTSSADLALSDIILLTGVLCLALYARSKLGKVNPV
ncbi:hypothetical protein HY945_04740 [Candidatus Gottesmanbacteria bacterium]|nr:hypothetical protein [Candidatus Gottesmanbacteria bacterium]